MNDRMILNILKQTFTQLLKLLGIGLLLIVCSCTKNESDKSSDETGPTPEEVYHIYTHYIEGHFSEYVSHIASCQGKPRFYREQIINLYKQQWEELTENYGKVDSIKIERIHKSDNNEYAAVYIRQYYSKAESEEILLQMVYTEKGWKIK